MIDILQADGEAPIARPLPDLRIGGVFELGKDAPCSFRRTYSFILSCHTQTLSSLSVDKQDTPSSGMFHSRMSKSKPLGFLVSDCIIFSTVIVYQIFMALPRGFCGPCACPQFFSGSPSIDSPSGRAACPHAAVSCIVVRSPVRSVCASDSRRSAARRRAPGIGRTYTTHYTRHTKHDKRQTHCTRHDTRRGGGFIETALPSRSRGTRDPTTGVTR